MKRARLKLYSYHSFLFIPFIVLFLYAHNRGLATLSMTWRTLGLGLLFTSAVFALVYAALRSRLKTGIFVTVFLVGMFQYGILYELLEDVYYSGHWPFRNIHRYLMALYLLFYSLLFFWLRRSTRSFVRVNYFLNVLLCGLLLYNVVLAARAVPAAEKLEPENTPLKKITFTGSAPAPNVYHIIADGYASNGVLRSSYGFSNHTFRKSLQEIGFRFADSALANYYFTSLSLCSTLNMSLHIFNNDVNERISDNVVMRTFKNNGYRVYVLPSGYVVSSRFGAADSLITIDGPNEFEKSVLRHTILRLDDLVGFFARSRLESQFREMHTMPALKSSPKYCFMHFVAPHPPFVFDSAGHMRARHRFAEHSWEPRSAYVGQLQYVNRQLAYLCREIVQNDSSAVIILQSDHGPWISAASDTAVFNARAGILYAYRMPASVKVPQHSTAVNTYPLLFNALFGTNLPLNPDSLAGKEALIKSPVLLKKVGATSDKSS